jgi:hypothetical protein
MSRNSFFPSAFYHFSLYRRNAVRDDIGLIIEAKAFKIRSFELRSCVQGCGGPYVSLLVELPRYRFFQPFVLESPWL